MARKPRKMTKSEALNVKREAAERRYGDLRRMAKAANQRMREMEKRNMKTPAYEAVQATLEMMGKRGTKDGGRRFSEKRYYNWKEAESIRSKLEKFLNAETGTVSGYKQYRDEVWDSAKDKLREAGSNISRDEYFEIWKNLPNKASDRVFGSEVYIEIVDALTKDKFKDMTTDEREMAISDIIGKIQESKTLKDAYEAAGLTYKDINKSIGLKFGD